MLARLVFRIRKDRAGFSLSAVGKTRARVCVLAFCCLYFSKVCVYICVRAHIYKRSPFERVVGRKRYTGRRVDVGLIGGYCHAAANEFRIYSIVELELLAV